MGEESRVEIISGTDKVMAIEIHDPLMVGQVGYDRAIMQSFEQYNISYILKATNANSITQVIWEDDLSLDLIAELKSRYYEVTVKPVALVCTLGTNIATAGYYSQGYHGPGGQSYQCGGPFSIAETGKYAVCHRKRRLQKGHYCLE